MEVSDSDTETPVDPENFDEDDVPDMDEATEIPGVAGLLDFMKGFVDGASEKEALSMLDCVRDLQAWGKTRTGPPPIQRCRDKMWDVMARSERFATETLLSVDTIGDINLMVLALMHKKAVLAKRFQGCVSDS